MLQDVRLISYQLMLFVCRQVSSIWQGLLQLIIILRAAITICNELNVHWNTEEVSWLEYTLIPQVKGDLCSSFVVVIGISLVLLYGISFFDCLYWLIDARRFILENRFQNIFIIIAVVVCSINASYFYSFVSETWTQSLNSVFQALHIVPTIIVVYYTFSIGELAYLFIYIICYPMPRSGVVFSKQLSASNRV